MESKEKFEPGKSPGTPYKVKLVDTKEFWSKEHPKWGWSYGYNVVVDGSDMTYFASASVKRIIDASGVKAGQEFILELRNIKDSSGDVKKAWYLDGKTTWDYEDNPPALKPEVAPEVFNALDSEPIVKKSCGCSKLEERVSALEDKMSEQVPF